MPMAFKPNYRLERAERDRLKKAKKEDKAKRHQERASQRQDSGVAETSENSNSPQC
jgi:hypothetical protein